MQRDVATGYFALAPPLSYRCARCNESTHYVQNCPLNEPHVFVPKKRTAVGIPRSSLKVVEGDTNSRFLTPDGRAAVFQANEEAFRMALGGIDDSESSGGGGDGGGDGGGATTTNHAPVKDGLKNIRKEKKKSIDWC